MYTSFLYGAARGASMRIGVGIVSMMLLFFFNSISVSAQEISRIDWIDQFGSVTQANDLAQSVDADGYMYVGGYTESALPGFTQIGGNDAFLRKYDRDGNVVWTDQFGTTDTDRVYGVHVSATAVYVSGYTGGVLPGETAVGGGDAFIRKYDMAGNVLWSTQFGTNAFDIAKSISADATGIYVVGDTQGEFAGQTQTSVNDAFVAKFDDTGSLGWVNQFGSTGYLETFDIAADSGVYIVGVTGSSLSGQPLVGGEDAFIRKYDDTGAELWTRLFGTVDFDQALSVAVNAGDVYVSGDTEGAFSGYSIIGNGDVFLQKFDASGNTIWAKQLGTIEYDQGYAVNADQSGVYIAGSTEGVFPGFTALGDADGFLIKYDPSGNLVWNYQYGSSDFDLVTGIAVTSDSVYVAGYTQGTIPGETSSGFIDVFVARVIQDTDFDNIFDEVDTDLFVYSNDFAESTTTGTVITRGDQLLNILIATSTNTGVLLEADPAGGVTQAEISMCAGSSTVLLDPGDQVEVVCGSVDVTVVGGEVEVVFYALDGSTALTSISAGNEIYFSQIENTYTAPATNDQSIVVVVDGVNYDVAPGETEIVSTDAEGPVAENATADPNPVEVNQTVVLSALISDLLTGGSHIAGAEYQIDGGAYVSMNAADGAYDSASETVTVIVPAFTEAGVHEVCVRGIDSYGNIGESSCVFLAVYDPGAGFVTGGGYIHSPVGAYVQDATLEGKAHFGFVSKYLPGAQTPSGNTQFRFKAGDFDFRSESYDWLVVANIQAKYKGVGSVNGVAGYAFMLTAVDGVEDSFRIKIWESATDTVVYDNKMDEPDVNYDGTELGGGNIIVHSS